jgi:hypothetical protein
MADQTHHGDQIHMKIAQGKTKFINNSQALVDQTIKKARVIGEHS